MDQMPPEAKHYKPSINIAQAPQLGAPLLYIGTAYVFLIVAALLFVVQGKWVAAGDYGRIAVVLLVHFFTLGFLSMTAMGILTQWVPVVFDTPAFSVRQARFHFGTYLLGVLIMALGLSQGWWPVVAAGGVVLALAIVVWSVRVMAQLRRSTKPRDFVYRGIQGAVFGFNVVWVLGVFMALAFVGWRPSFAVLPVHIATALVAWLGFLVLSVQVKLNPMFSMAKADGLPFSLPLYLAATGVLLGWISLFTSRTVLQVGAGFWVLTVLIAIVELTVVVKRGKSPQFDRVFIGVGVAWLLFLVAALLATAFNPLAVMVAFWGFLTLILTYQARILPFMVAVAVAKRLPGPVFKAFFMAQAMYSKNQPVFIGLLGLLGSGLAVWGRVVNRAGLEADSGIVALILVGAQLGGVALHIGRGRHQGVAAKP